MMSVWEWGVEVKLRCKMYQFHTINVIIMQNKYILTKVAAKILQYNLKYRGNGKPVTENGEIWDLEVKIYRFSYVT